MRARIVIHILLLGISTLWVAASSDMALKPTIEDDYFCDDPMSKSKIKVNNGNPDTLFEYYTSNGTDIQMHRGLHILQTRLLLFQGNNYTTAIGRTKLLFTLCYPTLVSQTKKDFIWFLHVDPDIIPEVRQELDYILEYPSDQPSEHSRHKVKAILIPENRVLGHAPSLEQLMWKVKRSSFRDYEAVPWHLAESVIVTSIDSDDGLTRNYIEEVRYRSGFHSRKTLARVHGLGRGGKGMGSNGQYGNTSSPLPYAPPLFRAPRAHNNEAYRSPPNLPHTARGGFLSPPPPHPLVPSVSCTMYYIEWLVHEPTPAGRVDEYYYNRCAATGMTVVLGPRCKFATLRFNHRDFGWPELTAGRAYKKGNQVFPALYLGAAILRAKTNLGRSMRGSVDEKVQRSAPLVPIGSRQFYSTVLPADMTAAATGMTAAAARAIAGTGTGTGAGTVAEAKLTGQFAQWPPPQPPIWLGQRRQLAWEHPHTATGASSSSSSSATASPTASATASAGAIIKHRRHHSHSSSPDFSSSSSSFSSSSSLNGLDIGNALDFIFLSTGRTVSTSSTYLPAHTGLFLSLFFDLSPLSDNFPYLADSTLVGEESFLHSIQRQYEMLYGRKKGRSGGRGSGGERVVASSAVSNTTGASTATSVDSFGRSPYSVIMDNFLDCNRWFADIWNQISMAEEALDNCLKSSGCAERRDDQGKFAPTNCKLGRGCAEETKRGLERKVQDLRRAEKEHKSGAIAMAWG